MILLDKLLAGLDIGVEPFALCDVGAGTRMDLAGNPHPVLHYVLAGRARLKAGGIDAAGIVLQPHTLLIVPPGLRQSIFPEDGDVRTIALPATCEPIGDGFDRLSSGSGGDRTLMACAAIRATYHTGVGLFDNLRDPIVEIVEDSDPLRAGLNALLAELAAPGPGTAIMTKALMTQCLVQVLRRHCESGECRLPWLTALEDPRLGGVVETMLDDLAAPHNLESLAALAGMSRSAFAQHFNQAFGRPAMDFLREMRLTQAARLLATTTLPVKTISGRVGYESRSYFSRAFKAQYGTDPAAYRAEQ